MTPPDTKHVSPEVRELDKALQDGLANEKRGVTFDMDDAPEATAQALAQFPKLKEALDFFEAHLRPVYGEADRKAIKQQKKHRILARVAILSGGGAIVFAILQLALKQTVPAWIWPAALLEGVAAFAGFAAVVSGLLAKLDHQWFLQRHIAERLRMLKFRALGSAEFWSGSMDAWREWVQKEMAAIQEIRDIKSVKAWAATDVAEPFEPTPPPCHEGDPNNAAVAVYYCRKRVGAQAAYFKRQSEKLKKESAWLHRAGLPLFFLSVVAVIVHFGVDYCAHNAHSAHQDADARRWEVIGIWALALAALLPVLGFGVRAWIGAFETARSSHLFAAKHRALIRSSDELLRDQSRCAATMHHIAHVEHFLEQEHREWLRLLTDAEWFL